MTLEKASRKKNLDDVDCIFFRARDSLTSGLSVLELPYLDFAFWDLVWFTSDPEDGPCLGQWLGVSHRVGSALCYHVLNSNGKIESRKTVQHVT